MTPQEAQSLAQLLRLTRTKLGLSVNEVGRRAGIDPATVSLVERKKIARPQVETLLSLAAVLRIPAADIFVLRNWIGKDDLPSFTPYMRAKYGTLPEDALRELEAHFEELAAKYGTTGPQNGEDEY